MLLLTKVLVYVVIWFHLLFTLTGYRLQVIHLADAFIQSDLQVVQTIKT